MTVRLAEAERIRRCRLSFERAMRDGTSVAVASQTAARDRWEDADRRLTMRRCGTSIPTEQAALPEQWWQRL